MRRVKVIELVGKAWLSGHFPEEESDEKDGKMEKMGNAIS